MCVRHCAFRFLARSANARTNKVCVSAHFVFFMALNIAIQPILEKEYRFIFFFCENGSVGNIQTLMMIQTDYCIFLIDFISVNGTGTK